MVIRFSTVYSVWRSDVTILRSKQAAVNSYDNTPLHLAAWYKSSKTAGLLGNKGADIKLEYELNWTPLASARCGDEVKRVPHVLQWSALCNDGVKQFFFIFSVKFNEKICTSA